MLGRFSMQPLHQGVAHVQRIYGGDRLVDLFLGHPRDAHSVTGGGYRRIATAVDGYKIHPFVRPSVVRLALVKGVAQGMLGMPGRLNGKVGLKQPVSQDAQAREHRAAQHHRRVQRRTVDVLYHVRLARRSQNLPHGLNQARPCVAVTGAMRPSRNKLDMEGDA